MGKHTPGPWYCSWNDNDLYDQGGVYRVQPIPVGSTWGKVVKQYNANANLIAAAPDLLEACKRLDIVLTRYKDHKIFIPLSIEMLWPLLKDAIAKAEGNS